MATPRRAAFWVRVDIEANARGGFNYVVITSTGYRATMERCGRDCCSDGYMSACARPLNEKHIHSSGVGSGSVDSWLKHSKRACHGWHDERVREFAKAVERTHGSHKPFTPQRACSGGHTSVTFRPECVAESLDITVEALVSELAKAAS